MKRKLYGDLCFIMFVLVFGVLGGLERNNISFGEAVYLSAILLFDAFVLFRMYQFEARRERRKEKTYDKH